MGFAETLVVNRDGGRVRLPIPGGRHNGGTCTARKEARLLKDALAGAALVIALQWAWIAWLLWFRKGH